MKGRCKDHKNLGQVQIEQQVPNIIHSKLSSNVYVKRYYQSTSNPNYPI